MKKFLEELIKRKKAELETLQTRSNESEDINEVRSIGAQIDVINAEIRDAQAQLDTINVQAENKREFNPLATYGLNGGQGEARDEFAGTTDSMEYRTAFMAYVVNNTPISQEIRENANTKTTDVGHVIPTQLVNRIIEKMEQIGTILPRVTKVNFKGGITIPTSNVKPVATWVAEGAGSERQKKSTGSISFAYHKLRCEISMSMEVGTMALSAFEAKFVDNVAKAMVIALEKAILNGNGTTQPKGILQETGVAKEFAAAVPTYEELVDIEMAIPAEYEAGAVWCMTKAQFGKCLSMTDQAGQPIARVNFGIGGKVERTLLGREVAIHPYADEVAALAGFIVDFADYCLNEIYDMGIQKKQDWETEDLLTKAVASYDGKMVDTGSLIKVTVKA